jgi:choline transport protein
MSATSQPYLETCSPLHVRLTLSIPITNCKADIVIGDGGTPFPRWISRISPKYNVPINAVYVTGLFSFILSLIYIGSPTAFYAITSLFTVALLQCYMFSIGSIFWRRIYLPDTIPKGPFSLGKWGLPINAVALIWCMWSFVSLSSLEQFGWTHANVFKFWSFWPIYTPTTPADFNWASVIFVAVIIVSIIHWYGM